MAAKVEGGVVVEFPPVLTLEEREKLGEIQGRARDMVDADHGRNEIWAELEEMYLLEDPAAPQNVDDYMTLSMKPRLAVDQVQDILCAQPPKVVVPQMEETKGGKEKAERVRSALQAVVYRAEEQGDEVMPQLVAQAAVFGQPVLKVLDRRKLWQWRGLKPEQYEDEAFPFAFIPLHPRSVHVRRVDDVVMAVVQEAVISGSALNDFYGSRIKWMGIQDSKATMTLVEYWDREWQATWVEGDADRPILGPVRHGMRMPFCIRNVRSGRFLGKLDREGQSILRPLYDAKSWRRMNLLMTALANNAYHMVNQAYVTKTRDGELPAGDVDKPGAMIPMYIDESIEPLRSGQIPETVKMLQVVLEAEMDLALLARVATGNSPGGVTAGYAVNILSQAARTKVNSIQKAVERCYADALQAVISYVREGGAVKVWGEKGMVELKPEDLGDRPWQVDVKLSASLPQDNIAKTQVAIAMKNVGVSQETILEDILEMSSEQEFDRKWGEAFRELVSPLRMVKVARKNNYAVTPEEEAFIRQKLGLGPVEQPVTAPTAGAGEEEPRPSTPPPLVGPGAQQQGNDMQGALMDFMASQAGRPAGEGGGAESPAGVELAMPQSMGGGM